MANSSEVSREGIEVVDGDQESLELKSLPAKDSQTKTE
jgi:hypothetical protein